MISKTLCIRTYPPQDPRWKQRKPISYSSFRVVSLRIPFILTIPRNTDFSPLFLSLARSSRVCKFLPRESRASAQVIYLESLLGLGVRARQRLLLFDNEHQRDGGL